MSLPGHVGTPSWLTLDADERVWLRAHPSKNLLLATLIVGTLLLIGLGVVAVLVDVGVATARRMSSVVLVFVFVLTAVVYLLTRSNEYVVTSHRICEAVGLTSKVVETVELADVDEVTVTQSRWQSWLNVGTLEFVGDGGVTIRFTLVEDPQGTRDRIVEAIETGSRPTRLA